MRRVVVVVGSAVLVWVVFVAGGAPQAGAARVEVNCTDSSSDAAMINAAIAGSGDGDEIVFSGTCSLTEPIVLVGHRSYRGESRTGTVLRQADGADLEGILVSESYLENIDRTGTPVSIRSLRVDGNRANNSAATNGIILRSWLTVIEDVQISQLDGHGILFTVRSQDGTPIEPGHTSVNGRIAGNFINDVSGHGLYVRDDLNALTDWNLLDNWIGPVGRSAIYLDNAAGWVIERNHVYGVAEHGIFADRLWGSAVSDNLVESFGSTSEAGVWYGIGATVQGGAASTISGNRVMSGSNEANTASTYRYLGIHRVNYGVGVVAVTGNSIHGAGTPRGTGLHYTLGPANELNVASSGNMVVNVDTELDIDGSPINIVYSDSVYLEDEPAECTQHVTGRHTGPLTVSEGVTCLDDARVTGQVWVEPGAALRSVDSRITGPLGADQATEITLCDTRVTGSVTLTAGAAVGLGDPASDCGANRITGTVQVVNTTGPSIIAGNTITGSLVCTGNDPAPTNSGVPNSVTGSKQGQCEDL